MSTSITLQSLRTLLSYFESYDQIASYNKKESLMLSRICDIIIDRTAGRTDYMRDVTIAITMMKPRATVLDLLLKQANITILKLESDCVKIEGCNSAASIREEFKDIMALVNVRKGCYKVKFNSVASAKVALSKNGKPVKKSKKEESVYKITEDVKTIPNFQKIKLLKEYVLTKFPNLSYHDEHEDMDTNNSVSPPEWLPNPEIYWDKTLWLYALTVYNPDSDSTGFLNQWLKEVHGKHSHNRLDRIKWLVFIVEAVLRNAYKFLRSSKFRTAIFDRLANFTENHEEYKDLFLAMKVTLMNAYEKILKDYPTKESSDDKNIQGLITVSTEIEKNLNYIADEQSVDNTILINSNRKDIINSFDFIKSYLQPLTDKPIVRPPPKTKEFHMFTVLPRDIQGLISHFVCKDKRTLSNFVKTSNYIRSLLIATCKKSKNIHLSSGPNQWVVNYCTVGTRRQGYYTKWAVKIKTPTVCDDCNIKKEINPKKHKSKSKVKKVAEDDDSTTTTSSQTCCSRNLKMKFKCDFCDKDLCKDCAFNNSNNYLGVDSVIYDQGANIGSEGRKKYNDRLIALGSDTIIVEGLRTAITEEKLRAFFNKYGSIAELKITNRNTICIITYNDPRDAKDALSANRKELDGRVISVNLRDVSVVEIGAVIEDQSYSELGVLCNEELSWNTYGSKHYIENRTLRDSHGKKILTEEYNGSSLDKDGNPQPIEVQKYNKKGTIIEHQKYCNDGTIKYSNIIDPQTGCRHVKEWSGGNVKKLVKDSLYNAQGLKDGVELGVDDDNSDIFIRTTWVNGLKHGTQTMFKAEKNKKDCNGMSMYVIRQSLKKFGISASTKEPRKDLEDKLNKILREVYNKEINIKTILWHDGYKVSKEVYSTSSTLTKTVQYVNTSNQEVVLSSYEGDKTIKKGESYDNGNDEEDEEERPVSESEEESSDEEVTPVTKKNIIEEESSDDEEEVTPVTKKDTPTCNDCSKPSSCTCFCGNSMCSDHTEECNGCDEIVCSDCITADELHLCNDCASPMEM